jgi:rare lipoprotein A
MLTGCGASVPRFTSRETGTKVISSLSEHQLTGTASYYADEFHGRKTSNGEVYDMHGLTAAHKTLPFNTKVKVVNLENGLSVVVRVNDRGPFKDERVIDLSLEAAKQLGLIAHGTASVRIEILDLGSDKR